MLTHLVGRLIARCDGREAARQQYRESRLPPLEVKRHLVIAVGSHGFEILEIRLARIEPHLVLCLVELQIDGAQHVLRGERLAVVPFDALAQCKGQRRAVLVPRPARREIGHDRFEARQRDVLIEQDQVVIYRHQRRLAERRRLLVNIQARRAVRVVDPQSAATLLGMSRGIKGEHAD